MLIEQTFSERKMRLIGNRFCHFIGLTLKRFEKKQKKKQTRFQNPFMERFRFVTVSF